LLVGIAGFPGRAGPVLALLIAQPPAPRKADDRPDSAKAFTDGLSKPEKPPCKEVEKQKKTA
jgi:hypothetical protein